MGATIEDGVLKIVHPGGYVEIHRRPVIAKEIMEKNPRHFVTRPDLFKFPWIVVRPESVLKPGNMFYIVPCHTLHRLLCERRSLAQNRPPPQGGATAFDERIKPVGAKSCLKKQSYCSEKSMKDRKVTFILPDGGVKADGDH